MAARIDQRPELPRTAGMVIVGGGVVGAATLLYAARAGIDAVLVERRSALATLTTPASTGAFRLQFDNREELDLVRESVELFLNFAEITGQRTYDLGIRRPGYLWCTTSEERAERQRELVDRQHGWGQTDIELLDGDEVRAAFPYVAPDIIQARYRAGDGFLDPRHLTLGLAAGSGRPVVLDCAVTGLTVDNGRVGAVETDRGRIATDTVVLAAGPFTARLAGTAGVNLPVEMVNRHKVVLPDVPAVPAEVPMTIDDDSGAHWRPFLRGAALLFTDPATPPSEPTDDVPPDHRHAQRLLDPREPTAVARIAPFWAEVWAQGSVTWMQHSGQYVVTPDHRPLLGPVGPAGLYVNTGYSGHGIMGAPAGSRHLIDVVTGRVGTNPFAVDRTFVDHARDLL